MRDPRYSARYRAPEVDELLAEADSQVQAVTDPPDADGEQQWDTCLASARLDADGRIVVRPGRHVGTQYGPEEVRRGR